MQLATSNKPNRVRLGALAGILFLLAGLIDGVVPVLHHQTSSHTLVSSQAAAGLMFAAVGVLWLATAWRWKRAADRTPTANPQHASPTS